MGRSAHVCRDEVCPCYKCSVCGAQWLLKTKLISHQKFSDCRLVLTIEENKHDLREATAPSVHLSIFSFLATLPLLIGGAAAGWTYLRFFQAREGGAR